MHNAVMTAGRFKRGETLLIQGASSGVGLMGMQIGKLMGASLMIGTSTNAQRRARLKEFSCDLALDSGDRKWPEQVKEGTGGKGVDLIVDMVSGGVASQNLEAAALLGRVVNVVLGAAAGAAVHRLRARGEGSAVAPAGPAAHSAVSRSGPAQPQGGGTGGFRLLAVQGHSLSDLRRHLGGGLAGANLPYRAAVLLVGRSHRDHRAARQRPFLPGACRARRRYELRRHRIEPGPTHGLLQCGDPGFVRVWKRVYDIQTFLSVKDRARVEREGGLISRAEYEKCINDVEDRESSDLLSSDE
jgi:Zinc-binding dehydrogenase